MTNEPESNDFKNGYNKACEDMIDVINGALRSKYDASSSIFSTLLHIKDHMLMKVRRG